MNWKHWRWLDDGVLPLLLALMRFAWLWPWSLLAVSFFSPSHQGVLLAPWLLITIPLLSLVLARLITTRPTVTFEATEGKGTPQIAWRTRVLVGGAGLLALVFALWWQVERAYFALWDARWLAALGDVIIHPTSAEVPVVWLMIATLIVLWLRGLLDAGQTLGHDDIWSAMVSGLVALVVYLLLVAGVGQPLLPQYSNYIVLFFAAGMAALALSGLKVTVGLDWALGNRSAKAPPLTRYWIISVTLIVTILLGLGVGIGLLIAPDEIARLLSVLNRVVAFVGWIIGMLALAIGYVLFVITYYLAELLRPLIEALLAAFANLPFAPAAEQGEAVQEKIDPLTVAAMPDSYRWAALALIALGVLLIFALVLRRLRALQEESIDERRESILSSSLLQAQLAKLWDKLRGRLQGERAIDPFLSLDGELDTRRQIRDIYQRLLAGMKSNGHAHLQHETPHEYQQQLVGVLPGAEGKLEAITEGYNYARYAPEPPSLDSAQSTTSAWAEVDQQIGAMPSSRSAELTSKPP